MQLLIGTPELQRILERGLVGGLWSIDQFNRDSKPGQQVLPAPGFLTEHPAFFDRSFRDLEAYQRGAGRRDWF